MPKEELALETALGRRQMVIQAGERNLKQMGGNAVGYDCSV